MHPFVGEIYFHAIDIVYLKPIVLLLHFIQNRINIDFGFQIYAVFDYEI